MLSFGTSPSSVAAIGSVGVREHPDSGLPSKLSLDQFIEALPKVLQKPSQSKEKRRLSFKERIQAEEEEKSARGGEDDPIVALFSRLVLNKEEWERFAFFEPSKKYTRNLISTDGESFTLLLLCWNPGKESPIHDHPCDGCWMRVCEGSVRESRYVLDEENDLLRCNSDNIYKEGTIGYIADSMGYHKVGNPSSTTAAVTMHLYAPPFQHCKIWLDPSHASKSSRSCVCYDSKYGCQT